MLHYNINLVLGEDSSEQFSSVKMAEAFSTISNLIKEGNLQGEIAVENLQQESVQGIWNFTLTQDECEGAYMVYTCDVWHSEGSKNLIGVIVDKENVLPFIEAYVENNGGSLNPDDRHLLETIQQTQGLENLPFEIMYEQYKTI